MDKNAQADTLLTRRVEKVLPDPAGLRRLLNEKKIRVYLGVDPTGSRLHLGHSIALRQLGAFAEAGHTAILLFGTGTVLVGDPSQRGTGRKLIIEEEIEKNIKNWKDQVAPIIDLKKVKIRQNGEWLTKLILKDIIKIASNISAVQLFKREMFTRRVARGDTVWYHETMYPLLQGYDSVVMDVDLEIGGTDQEFNMLIGRELQKKMNNRQKYVLTVPMILGTDGKQMSKSSGNCLWLDDSPDDMFGKIMSIPDDQIIPYLQLATNLPMHKVGQTEENLNNHSLHPIEAKKLLAQTVVSEFHNTETGKEARGNFEKVFQGQQSPEKLPEYETSADTVDLVDILTQTKLAKSRSDAKRLLFQGAIEWNGEKTEQELTIDGTGTLRVGKYRFLRIVKK